MVALQGNLKFFESEVGPYITAPLGRTMFGPFVWSFCELKASEHPAFSEISEKHSTQGRKL